MIKLRDNRQRAKNAITLLWVAIAMAVLGIAIEAYEVKMLYDLKNMNYDEFFFIAENQQSLLIVLGLAGLLLIGISITTWVFYIMWFRRAYFNMHLLKKRGLRYGEGMAAGAWFIPIFNWFGPYQIARELFTNAQNMLADKGLIQADPRRLRLVGLWWGLWVGSNIISTVTNQSDKFEDLDTQIILCYIGIFASVMQMVAGVFAIRVVKEYAMMEELLPKLGEDVNMTTSDDSDLLDSGI